MSYKMDKNGRGRKKPTASVSGDENGVASCGTSHRTRHNAAARICSWPAQVDARQAGTASAQARRAREKTHCLQENMGSWRAKQVAVDHAARLCLCVVCADFRHDCALSRNAIHQTANIRLVRRCNPLALRIVATGDRDFARLSRI